MEPWSIAPHCLPASQCGRNLSCSRNWRQAGGAPGAAEQTNVCPNMRSAAALAALVAACALTACAGEAWLNPTTGDGGDGDGDSAANGTAAQQLCGSSGGWRSTALAQRPTANEDFKPESAPYWKAAVVPAAWPAGIGLAAAVALLLLFLLWCGMAGACAPWRALGCIPSSLLLQNSPPDLRTCPPSPFSAGAACAAAAAAAAAAAGGGARGSSSSSTTPPAGWAASRCGDLLALAAERLRQMRTPAGPGGAASPGLISHQPLLPFSPGAVAGAGGGRGRRRGLRHRPSGRRPAGCWR